MSAPSPESQWNPRLHPRECGQQVEGGDSPPLLCSLLTWSDTHCSDVPNIRRSWNCWIRSKAGYEVAEGTGTLSLWRQVERAGAVQPVEDEVVWRPHSTFQYLRRPQGNWRDTPHQEQVAQGGCGFPKSGSVQDRLDNALSNLIWWKVSLPTAEGLGLYDLWVLSNSFTSFDLAVL